MSRFGPAFFIASTVLAAHSFLLAAGMAIGVPASLACGRLVQSTLFGLAALDPVNLAAAMLVLSVTAALAGYLPARRAARVDPNECPALRVGAGTLPDSDFVVTGHRPRRHTCPVFLRQRCTIHS
jgi:hypothetical protein